MKTTTTLAHNFGCTPFDIFDRECDEVIVLINYYIELGAEADQQPAQKKPNKEQRIRVNDETATGGWF